MKKCPYCDFELPDDYDSEICDDCGGKLNRCTNPACGVFTVAAHNNCLLCGAETVPNGSAPAQAGAAPGGTAAPAPVNTQAATQGQAAVAQVQQTPVVSSQADTGPARTELAFGAGGGGLYFYHYSEGWNMQLADGDILGRVNGNHTDRLGGFKVISGTHAQITRNQDNWYITDLGSLNKTWVNNVQAMKDQPVRIKGNDVVTLANIKFTVIEA